MADLPAFPWTDVLIIFALVVLNGVFAMSELAIVSARAPRLQSLAEKGSAGAKMALQLAADPGKFLSTVQIGITLIGILNGAYSGASLGGPTAMRLERLGLDADLAETLGFAIVIGLTTFASLVIGELVPKQFSLRHPERVAVIAALPMRGVAILSAPFVWLLDSTSTLILKLLRMDKASDDSVTAEELHMIFAEATKSGVIEESERRIMSGVMRLADRPVREVMTPRTEVDWIEKKASEDEIKAQLLKSPHSLLLVANGSIDQIVGVVQARDIAVAILKGRRINLARAMRPAPIIPDQLDAMDAMRVLQKSDVSMGLVHDEYGQFEGVVTPADLLSAIVGQFASHQDEGDSPMIITREDGSLLISGALPADALASRLGITLDEDRDYATAAGHVLAVLRRLPHEGDHFIDQGWRFEIVDMDGRKIDKLLVSAFDVDGDGKED